MKKIAIMFVFASILLFAQSAFGLTKYGDATINKGLLIVVRSGQALRFTDPDQTYEILKYDVLKAGADSMITLNTVEDAVVRMGSNAVFQVRPWKQKKRRGYLRMLYGKALFMTKRMLARKRGFGLKTATAVMGVRGTRWKTQVASSGIQETEVREGIVGIMPTYSTIEIAVNRGERSLTLNANRAIKAAEIPGEPEEEPSTELDSAAPTSEGAVEVDNQDFYVENELSDTDEFEESEKETADIDEEIEEPEEVPPEAEEDEPAEEAEEGPGEAIDEEADIDLEEDLIENEDLEETELIVEIPFDLADTMEQDDIIAEGLVSPETDLPDTSDILDDVTNTVDDAVNVDLQQSGEVKITIEK